MTVAAVLFLLGIFLIVKGGDWFVDAAGWLAKVSGIPPVIIGATVVSLATTLPELLVSVIAAVEGKTAMAVGNAVGSVNANIGLIMAAAVLWAPAVVRRRELAPKALLMLVACLLLWLLSFHGVLTGFGAGVLLVLFGVFLAENLRGAKQARLSGEPLPRRRGDLPRNVGKFLLGAAAIIVGARLLVEHGSTIARCLGVSEAVIGVTIVAIGTSLPELVTTVTALVKKQSELSLGNIIGANIIDLTLILSVCSLLSDGQLPVSRQSVLLDSPVSLLLAALAVLPPLICGRFRRGQGLLLLLLYGSYLLLVTIGVPLPFL